MGILHVCVYMCGRVCARFCGVHTHLCLHAHTRRYIQVSAQLYVWRVSWILPVCACISKTRRTDQQTRVLLCASVFAPVCVCVHVYVSTYKCIYMCTPACLCISICTPTCTNIPFCTSICIFMHVHVCTLNFHGVHVDKLVYTCVLQ